MELKVKARSASAIQSPAVRKSVRVKDQKKSPPREILGVEKLSGIAIDMRAKGLLWRLKFFQARAEHLGAAE